MRIKDSPNKISFYTKPKTVPFSLLSKVYKSQQNITGKYCGTPCILKECNFRATIGALVYQESLPERSFPIFTRSSVYLIKYVVKLMKLCTSHSAPNLRFCSFIQGSFITGKKKLNKIRPFCLSMLNILSYSVMIMM